MTGRGRHARSNGFGFYRDVLLLIAGILVVGAVVFGGLSLWAGGSDDDANTTTTSAGPTTTSPDTAPTSTTTSTAPPATEPTTTTTTAPDTTPSTAAPSTVGEGRPPGEVRVVVLNSIGVTGLAGSLSDDLAQLGYQTAPADNYTPELSDTMVFHADGFSVEAINLADELPDATVAPDPDLAGEWGVDVVVVIGQSYQE